VALVGAEQAPVLARPYYGDGPVSPITATLAHVPELLEATLPFVGAALGPGSLGARTKEIAVLRTSALLECRYCVQSHSVVALDTGLSAAEVRGLRGELAVDDAFSDPDDRLLLRWIDAVAGGRGSAPTELRDEVRRALGDPGLVELTLTVGATLMLNRYCTALALPTSPAVLERLAREGLA